MKKYYLRTLVIFISVLLLMLIVLFKFCEKFG
ncbi:hypothetical protein B0S88_0004 [Caldicellulosiruptor bescii]|nr:hypothetical protein B0S88_0004 [Caldicellulosiruptor bescii]